MILTSDNFFAALTLTHSLSRFGFDLKNVNSKKRGNYCFKASSEEDRSEWMAAIGKCRTTASKQRPLSTPAALDLKPVAESPKKEDRIIVEPARIDSPKEAEKEKQQPSEQPTTPTAAAAESTDKPKPIPVKHSQNPVSPKVLPAASAAPSLPRIEETEYTKPRDKRIYSVADVVKPSEIDLNQNSKYSPPFLLFFIISSNSDGAKPPSANWNTFTTNWGNVLTCSSLRRDTMKGQSPSINTSIESALKQRRL